MSEERDAVEAPLITAIRSGDTDRLQDILAEGGDPDTRDARGAPALCLAIQTYSHAATRLLITHGADPRTCGPDAVRPLRRAVESGSPALVEALLARGSRPYYPSSELLEMRELALHRYRCGAETELRRRTGAGGAVTRTRVKEEDFLWVDELTLAGATVREGHAAILTLLEEALRPRTRLRVPFRDMRDRAMSFPDQEHAVWAGVTMTLAYRRDQETWTAAEALRTHPGPLHRLLGAEVLRLTHLFDESDEDAFAAPALEIFLDWSTHESDHAVLAEVLTGVAEHGDQRGDLALLPHAGHPVALVRHTVAAGFSRSSAFPGGVRAALLELTADPDALVREAACRTIAVGRDRDPALADAMAARLTDEVRRVRFAAVDGLALHDDERCVEGERALRPGEPGDPLAYELSEVWRYQQRREAGIRIHPLEG
ncbi:HEAT repeat domain-containing protein [Streptomyces sp. NBC_01335]|uniref:ankyrin repeat domain-containing protein n=1 Tax=Streptomyces sp. NBC_01335 TaxID=2903828 RepID=UPI002E0DED19|nr:HEAT repeat domain-containing protein [Streptomyces sp. NBC_01335]